MSGKAIQVKDLRKSFKANQVLKSADYEVRRGDIFSLLGSNGADKPNRSSYCKWLRRDASEQVAKAKEIIICVFFMMT